MLELEGLQRTIDGHQVLSAIDLRVGDGEEDLADPVQRRGQPRRLAAVIGLLQFGGAGVVRRHLADRLQVVAKHDLLGGGAGLLLHIRALAPALGIGLFLSAATRSQQVAFQHERCQFVGQARRARLEKPGLPELFECDGPVSHGEGLLRIPLLEGEEGLHQGVVSHAGDVAPHHDIDPVALQEVRRLGVILRIQAHQAHCHRPFPERCPSPGPEIPEEGQLDNRSHIPPKVRILLRLRSHTLERHDQGEEGGELPPDVLVYPGRIVPFWDGGEAHGPGGCTGKQPDHEQER